jgi:hypothetical protein
VHSFQRLESGSENSNFAESLKHINKKYIKPRSKLPMLTQGVRTDIEDDMRNPSVNM